MNLILQGTLAAFLAGSCTVLGAVPALLGRKISPKAQDGLLGFAAGVMLAASFFSLILPSIGIATALYGGRFLPAAIAVAGFVIGVAGIAAANEWIPHLHFIQGAQGPRWPVGQKVWLFVAAITIHNFPEGMAVGVGFATGDMAAAIALATGIGIQNAPEGLAVAVALIAQGYGKRSAFLVAAATAIVEPLGGFLGAGTVSLFRPFLPWALAIAAGAMIYVISHEIIPETHTRGHQHEATIGLTAGLAVMMFLDVALG